MLQNKSSEENFLQSSVILPAQQSFADFPPVGIDSLALYTPGFYLDLTELAQARGVDPNKYTIGIGQDHQAVAPSNQDIVTMGAAAGLKALYFADSADASDTGHTNIGLLVVGTESGVDASKASALFIHDLIGLGPWCRSIEIKEACYGGTAGLMTAVDYVHTHPGKKALVIASDIARYGLNTPGEVTQGAGAVAMVISENPRILALEPQSTAYSRSIGDFWRPVYTDMALARGKSRRLRRAIDRQTRELFRERLSVLRLGLENRLGDRIGLLSGGQRQAVSLLMASLRPSSILLLDEHTAALDPKTAAFVLELTDRVVKEGRLTTLRVTHSMRQALDYGTRTVMLHQGQVVLDVSGEERARLDVADLLAMFERTRGEELSDDSLLLG